MCALIAKGTTRGAGGEAELMSLVYSAQNKGLVQRECERLLSLCDCTLRESEIGLLHRIRRAVTLSFRKDSLAAPYRSPFYTINVL